MATGTPGGDGEPRGRPRRAVALSHPHAARVGTGGPGLNPPGLRRRWQDVRACPTRGFRRPLAPSRGVGGQAVRVGEPVATAG